MDEPQVSIDQLSVCEADANNDSFNKEKHAMTKTTTIIAVTEAINSVNEEAEAYVSIDGTTDDHVDTNGTTGDYDLIDDELDDDELLYGTTKHDASNNKTTDDFSVDDEDDDDDLLYGTTVPNSNKIKPAFTRLSSDGYVTNITFSKSQKNEPVKLSYDGCKIPEDMWKALLEDYNRLLLIVRPYAYYIKLTFDDNISIQRARTNASLLIKELNKRIFQFCFDADNDHLEGVVALEMPGNWNQRNKQNIVIHVLLMEYPWRDDETLGQLPNIFNMVAFNVKYRTKLIFNNQNTNFLEIVDNRVINHCFKEVWKKDLSNLGRLSYGGITWDS